MDLNHWLKNFQFFALTSELSEQKWFYIHRVSIELWIKTIKSVG
jgi:hypothetical protein